MRKRHTQENQKLTKEKETEKKKNLLRFKEAILSNNNIVDVAPRHIRGGEEGK